MLTQLAPTPTSSEAADELDTFEICGIAARAAAEKKGDHPIVLDVGELVGIVDAFVIVSASNTRLVATIVEEIEEQVKILTGLSPRMIEGLRDAQWVLMDYGMFIVHVFLEEAREFYDLERLWKDAPRPAWE